MLSDPKQITKIVIKTKAEERDGSGAKLSIPTIDLHCIDSDSVLRAAVVEEIRYACKNWGFFQVKNGIPVDVLDRMVHGMREFHEQENGLKKELCSKDAGNKEQYLSSKRFYKSEKGNWRDTFVWYGSLNPPKPEELPSVCREIVIEYSKQVKNLGYTLFELLSEALGMNPNKLKDMDCAEELSIYGHYYPPCPKQELTIGTDEHTDGSFITMLLQDKVSGLQVLYENQWVNVPHMEGALVINVGDLLQLVTNDKFISVDPRVIAQSVGPRVSVASFFMPDAQPGNSKVYGPIKELLSEENAQIYREVNIEDYLKHYVAERVKGNSALLQFKL